VSDGVKFVCLVLLLFFISVAVTYGFIWGTVWLWTAFSAPVGFLIWCAAMLLIVCVYAAAEIMGER
jgi:hypothetical protein